MTPRALAGGCLAVLLAGWLPASGEPTPPPPAAWSAIEGTWAASGQRLAVAIEGGSEAAIVEVSGPVLLSTGAGLSRGFQGQAVGFDDGQGQVTGRCVWTDENGDRVFSRVKGEPLGTGKRLVGSITGGTGRYAGLEGEYSLVWQYVVRGEDGRVQARAARLTGRVRQGSPQP